MRLFNRQQRGGMAGRGARSGRARRGEALRLYRLAGAAGGTPQQSAHRAASHRTAHLANCVRSVWEPLASSGHAAPIHAKTRRRHEADETCVTVRRRPLMSNW